MRYDDQLKRKVPSTLGEYRSYFDDANPEVLGGPEAKSAIMQTIDVLIDAAPGHKEARPSADHTTMVQMILTKARELSASVKMENEQLSDLEVLVEGAKLTRNPAKMIEVAKRIEKAASSPGVNLLRAAQARALAQSLRVYAATGPQ